MSNKKKICIITANYFSFMGFIKPWHALLSEDFHVSVIGNFDDTLSELQTSYPLIDFISVKMERNPSIISDLKNTWLLFWYLMRLEPDFLYSMMPKSGLLGQLAGYLCSVPVRLHIFTGQIWTNFSGKKRTFYKLIDKLIVYLATDTATDSRAQQELLIKEGITRSNAKARIFGDGSICGISNKIYRNKFEIDFNICEQRPLKLLFMARVTRSKGFLDLLDCVRIMKADNVPLELFVCGPDEEFMIASNEVDKSLFTYLSYTDKPDQLFEWADVICLPSYREGLAMTLLQAVAAGVLPVVSNIPGCTEMLKFNDCYTFGCGEIQEWRKCLEGVISAEPALLATITRGNHAHAMDKYNYIKVYNGFLEILNARVGS